MAVHGVNQGTWLVIAWGPVLGEIDGVAWDENTGPRGRSMGRWEIGVVDVDEVGARSEGGRRVQRVLCFLYHEVIARRPKMGVARRFQRGRGRDRKSVV